jgi:hypothetical protein
MKTRKALLICICCLLAASAAWGQTASSASKPGVLGYFDPQTGTFRPIPAPAAGDADAPAATTFTGTINVTLTITLKTAGLATVSCSQGVTVVDGTTAPVFYSESDSVAATGSGTRTCKLSIPYSWSLTTQSSDSMSTTYTVIGIGSTGTSQRSSTMSPLDTRKVPANGTITNLTANVTL